MLQCGLLHTVKCVCQMYYQEIGINRWKVKFVFVSSDHLEVSYERMNHCSLQCVLCTTEREYVL